MEQQLGEVATPIEILIVLTKIVRGEIEAKPAEILRAAELLGRRYCLFADQAATAGEGAVIVDDLG